MCGLAASDSLRDRAGFTKDSIGRKAVGNPSGAEYTDPYPVYNLHSDLTARRPITEMFPIEQLEEKEHETVT